MASFAAGHLPPPQLVNWSSAEAGNLRRLQVAKPFPRMVSVWAGPGGPTMSLLTDTGGTAQLIDGRLRALLLLAWLLASAGSAQNAAATL
eukprot:3761271-Lingulodinium_polyedra.AAC.1